MAFESWTSSPADRVRRNRLLFGYVIGASIVGAGIAFVVLTSSANVAAQEEEDAKVVEVQLAKEPEPEPEPPPPPPELKHHVASGGPRLPKIETPTAITNERPAEKDVKPSSAGSGDPYEKGSGDGTGGPAAAVVDPGPVKPAAPPPPPINKPRPVSETDVPPEMVGADVRPEYPPEAKAAGIEGVVLVRYVVTESGEVKDVKAVKGPPELFAACVAAVKALRFKPAHDAQGNAISVVKYKRFHLRITT
ncbi:MAG TPA: TonB family protein [Polyangiaceae bacterium]